MMTNTRMRRRLVLHLLLVLSPCFSFLLTTPPHFLRTSDQLIHSSTQLWGFRDSLRQRIPFLPKRQRKQQINGLGNATENILVTEESKAPVSSMSPPENIEKLSAKSSEAFTAATEANGDTFSTSITSSTSTITLIDEIITELPNGTISLRQFQSPDPSCNSTLYELVPRNSTTLTKYELEFREMLLYFANLTVLDFRVLDPRTRALFQGVAASARQPAVYRAFEVLYQDILPLRIAGRVIFQRLQEVLQQAVDHRNNDMERVLQQVDVDKDRLLHVWYRFVQVALDWNGAPHLTRNQLGSITTLRDICSQVLGISVQDLLTTYVDDDNDRIDFVTLYVGLQACAQDMCTLDRCHPADVLAHATYALEEDGWTTTPSTPATPKNSRKSLYERQYNEMVEAFVGWRPYWTKASSSSKSRRLDIVEGCFVGATCPEIVNALRIVYVDYSALRISGDLIFGIVSSFMKTKVE